MKQLIANTLFSSEVAFGYRGKLLNSKESMAATKAQEEVPLDRLVFSSRKRKSTMVVRGCA